MLSESLSSAWWSLLLRGLLALVFGLLAIAAPGASLIALTLWFGVFALVDGVFLITGAFAGRREHEHWYLMLLEGLVGVVFGLLTLRVPGITALILLMYIAAFAMITGVLRLVTAIRLRREIEGEWWMAISGVAGVLFGGLMLMMPGAGALAMMIYIGAWALVVGVSLVFLALRVRRIKRTGERWGGRAPMPAH
jgi:uncharacterized membrane protein HdeD (DUF308 family)